MQAYGVIIWVSSSATAAWRRAGAVIARTATTGVTASRQNDVLLATQSRERGWVIVTRDRDFDAVRQLIKGLQVATPYPERP